MAKEILYKSYSPRLLFITDSEGRIFEEEEKETELKLLKDDVQIVTDLVEYHLTTELLEEFNKLESSNSIPTNTAGRCLGISIVDEYREHGKTRGRTGLSRLQAMFDDRLARELKSWNARVKAAKEEFKGYVSSGWKRTAHSQRPSSLKPKISLSSADAQYCRVAIIDDIIELSMVIKGMWRKLYFSHDQKRFGDADSVSKPDITISDTGDVRFSFAYGYAYNYSEMSSRYIVAVDVGIAQYATVVVWDTQEKEIVLATTLSQRVHSLANKVRKVNKQISDLYIKGKKSEVPEHRESNTRRKKELAILAAQEIAHIAHEWDNAVVVFEDLSWVSNTMQNGRWNRGELVKRTEEYVELNGSRVFKVNPHNTSQVCYRCHEKITHNSFNRTVYCSGCGIVEDRDVNAAANIAQRGEKSVSKAVKTRRKAKGFTKRKYKRSKNGSGANLKYPGRDRTKNYPTPSRVSRGGGKRCLKEVDLTVMCSAGNNDDCTMVAADTVGICPGMTVTSNTTKVMYPLLI